MCKKINHVKFESVWFEKPTNNAFKVNVQKYKEKMNRDRNPISPLRLKKKKWI